MTAGTPELTHEELYEDAPCGYLSLLADGTILATNRTLLRTLGREAAQVVGVARLQDLMAPGSRIYHATHWGPKLELQGEVREIPVDLVRADGDRVAVLLSAVVRHGDGSAAPVIRASVFDATDRRRYERELIAARDTEREARRKAEHLARHDRLTGLPNRALVDERLARAGVRVRRDGGAFLVCLVDLDHFRVVNESLGHQAGDDLLREVAERLRRALPDADTIGRVGGDEFVVLAAGDDATPSALAARIGAALDPPFVVDGLQRVVRASMGIAVSDPDAPQDDLLRDADIAMYRAKERRREGHVVFDPTMRERTQARLRVEAELRVALAEGQLRVFYQPVVAARDRRIVGMEALVRWEHPERGLVPPGEFIPVAEQFGLVGALGRFVLEESCRQLAAWRRDGVAPADLGVAVNVSARQFEQPGFAAEVAGVLRGAGLDAVPGLVGLEVTETLLMQSGDDGAGVLAELSALGVELLLDDFGTGVSSLARLKRLPVDTLKIDRAFIVGLGESDEDAAIVAAIVAMAEKLDLEVVAEGAELESQLALLEALGCCRVQGFVFSRPLPAEELAAYAAAPSIRT
jgi:diguanylate cyclase (GGDEF)-like protein/PAS domain S-box-containing protein